MFFDYCAVDFVFQEFGGDLEAKIESLLNVEKQMRLAGDVAATKKAVTDILELCFEARAWKTLNDQIVLLSKRRGQLKQVCPGKKYHNQLVLYQGFSFTRPLILFCRD